MLKLSQTIVHIEISGHHSSGFNLFVNKKHILEQIERILPSVKSKLNLKGFGGKDYGTLNHMAKICFMSWPRFGTKSALRHMVARNRCTITPMAKIRFYVTGWPRSSTILYTTRPKSAAPSGWDSFYVTWWLSKIHMMWPRFSLYQLLFKIRYTLCTVLYCGQNPVWITWWPRSSGGHKWMQITSSI